MVDIVEGNEFVSVPLIEEGEDVKGGLLGPSNKQAIALVKRTAWLKGQMEALQAITSGINLIGTLDSVAELEAIDTTDLPKGTAYFVDAHLRVWNGTDWTDSNSLLGPRGITFLGVWPNNQDLPEPQLNAVGDAYVWQNDIHLLLPEPDFWVKIGLPGAPGKSAYEIAVDKGFVGNEQAWLDSQEGDDAYQIAVADGFVGTPTQWLASLKGKGSFQSAVDTGWTGTEAEWVASLIGKSSYQSALDTGFVGTEAQWVQSLKGKSTYQSAVDTGFDGTEAEFVLGLKGDSVYQEWIKAGNTGTFDQFIETLKVKGDDGDTVYEQWLTEGNTGSFDDFVATLKVKGDKGEAAAAFVVKGSKPTMGDLPQPGVAVEAWYVGTSLYVWLADSQNYMEIPGVGGKSAYEIAVADGFEGTESEYLESLVGKDAYQIAVSEGFQGTQPEWLASLKAKTLYEEWLVNGNVGSFDDFLLVMKIKGDKGDSVYQEWLAAGNTGSFEDFTETLKVKGDTGRNLAVLGTVANAAALADKAKDDQAAYVTADNGHLFIYILTTDTWTDLGPFRGLNGTNGKTNFELAQDEGFEGTVAEYLESLEGKAAYQSALDTGFVGSEAEWVGSLKGKTNFQLAVDEGFTGTLPEYLESMKGVDGKSNYEIAVEAGFEGTVQQYLDGLKGKDGSNGKTNYQIALDEGFVGTPQEYLNSLKGKAAYQSALDAGFVGTEVEWVVSLQGKDGRNVVIKGSVANQAALPVGAAEQDAYTAKDTGILWMWVSGAWLNLGKFRGEDGVPVDIIKILTADDSVVPSAAANPGKAYIDLEKYIYVSVDGAWQLAGTFKGDQGNPGQAMRILDTVADIGELPLESTAAEGDAYFTADDKMLWVLTDGQWAGPFNITGLQGIKGDTGEKGEAGTSINILDAYPTLAALQAAHPTGVLGDGYLVVNDLVIWSTADGGGWKNVGPVRGPQGIRGPEGPASTKPGPPGPSGSRWLTLPDDMDVPSAGYTGNTGDWAVSKNFDVFYKTANQGWLYFGKLTAGDVNSPLRSVGKVVRWGDEWVPLLVDEVPAMVSGKRYVRVLKNGSTTNEGVWAELADGIADITVKDGKQYVRVFETNGTTPIWKELAASLPDLTVKDGKTYARVFEVNGSAPIWKEIVAGVPFPANITDGKTYVMKNGAWASFDRYDLLVKGLTASATIDATVDQFLKVNNSTATAKTFTFSAGPAGRAMTLVMKIDGVAGTITIAVASGVTLVWNGGTPPTGFTGTRTVLTLLWDGTEYLASIASNVP